MYFRYQQVLHRFLDGLEQKARAPILRLDLDYYFTIAMRYCQPQLINQIRPCLLASIAKTAVELDIIHTTDEVQDVFRRGLGVALVPVDQNVNPKPQFDIKSFFTMMEELNIQPKSVVDGALPVNNMTRPSSMAEMKDYFNCRPSQKAPLNYLDLPCPDTRFRPQMIAEVDLLSRIVRAAPHLEKQVTENGKEWFVCSAAGAITTFHEDAVGKCASLHIFCGRKAFYFLGGDSEVGKRLLTVHGSGSVPDGARETLMGPGDTIIMAPGVTHAVVCYQDSVLVGEHFYTRRLVPPKPHRHLSTDQAGLARERNHHFRRLCRPHTHRRKHRTTRHLHGCAKGPISRYSAEIPLLVRRLG